ncbi:hypothetical protein RvY_16674 [Ramazzottius varieornatus]|uniref:Uncharacterized protein n=1 Tax=Ramazzottius varieornatus TaxID=947166 RepID=A0A1D1W5M3_RAMVA|nr:hypothetical protein RvY_16674 [Ramazzottius varieornatus]
MSYPIRNQPCDGGDPRPGGQGMAGRSQEQEPPKVHRRKSERCNARSGGRDDSSESVANVSRSADDGCPPRKISRSSEDWPEDEAGSDRRGFTRGRVDRFWEKPIPRIGTIFSEKWDRRFLRDHEKQILLRMGCNVDREKACRDSFQGLKKGKSTPQED